MKIKDILSAFCLLSLGFTMLSVETYASESTDKTLCVKEEKIMEYEEYVKENISSIIEKCEKGIINASIREGCIESDKGEKITFPVYEYSDIIYDDDKVVAYVDTNVWEISASSLSDYQPFSKDPISGSTSLFYESTNEDGMIMWRLTKGTGQYSVLDTAFSVTKQAVEMIQYGAGGKYGLVNDSCKKNPTSSSWSFNTGFSNKVVKDSNLIMQMKWTLTVARQSSFTITIDHSL